MKSLRLFVFLLFQFSLMTSFANNPGVSYQGRIFKPDGNPLEGSSVQFRLQVRSPGSENCLLYEEVQTLNMAGSSGVFALTLNDGTGTRLDTATYQVDRIFANRETMTLDTTRCAAGTTYTPNSADGRKLVVYFKDETMAAYEAMPLMNLNYVPQAMYALEAQKVDKFEVSHILRAVDGSGNPATAPALNPTQLTNLNTLLATPAANYVQTTSNGSAALPIVAGNPSSGLAAGQIWYDSGSNVMKYYDGAVKTFGTSGGGVTSVATGTGLTGGPITTTGTINVDVGVTTGKIVQVAASNKLPVIDGSNLTNITATDATKLPLAGGTMTGPLVNNSNSASTALAVTQAGAGHAATFMGGNVGIGTASPTNFVQITQPNSSSGSTMSKALEVIGGLNSSGLLPGIGGGVSFVGGSGMTGGAISLTGGTATGTYPAPGASLTLNGGYYAGGGGSANLAAADSYNGFQGADVSVSGGNGSSRGFVLLNKNGGNVGVGTTSPTSPLHAYGVNAGTGIFQVESSTSGVVFKAGSSTGAMVQMVGGGGIVSVAGGPGTGRLNVGSLTSNSVSLAINGIVGQTADLFRVDTTTGTTGSAFKIDSSGNVGIGTANPTAKLDVNGEIKIGNSASSCNGTNEGQQRYNATSKVMEFCNGTAWTSLSGGTVPAGTWCGHRSVYYSGASTWSTPTAGTVSSDCSGSTLTISGTQAAPTLGGCPADYTATLIRTGYDGTDGFHYFVLTCLKN